ncbi:MAG: tetraacyldisaccharide 4'-kinase [Planctomycetota bacterium]
MSQRIEERLARGGPAIECLRAPAALFGILARLRGSLYSSGWLKSYRLDVPIVSVGNLTAGGTGKTPFIVWLVRWFQEQGLKPGILSRGYRADQEGANDEGRLLAQLFPDVPHKQGADRVQGAAELVDVGVDVILLDDGFQHRRLVRDLDLVLIDATQPFGFPLLSNHERPGALLPRGLMREPKTALTRAHALVLTRTDQCAPQALAALEDELEAIAPGVPRLTTQHRAQRLRVLRGEPSAPAGGEALELDLEHSPKAEVEIELSRLDGLEVDLLSGIGNPEAFQATVEALGARIATHRTLPDHHHYGLEDLREVGDARPLVTTAKDAVKLESLRNKDKDIWILDVEMRLDRGLVALETLLGALPPAKARALRDALHAGLSG